MEQRRYRNYLPSLSSRRELATSREIRRIQAEPNHPCHSLLPDPRDHPYELRKIIYTQFLLNLKDINNLLLLDLLNMYKFGTNDFFNLSYKLILVFLTMMIDSIYNVNPLYFSFQR